MKQKTATRLFLTALVLIAAAIVALAVRPRDRALVRVPEDERLEALQLLLSDLPEQSNDYIAYLRRNPVTGPSEPISLELLGDEGATLTARMRMSFAATIPQDGSYAIHLTYRRTDRGLTNTAFALRHDREPPFNASQTLALR